MYVDDFLLWQDVTVLDLAACLVLALCAAFRVPIPWPKVQLGFSVVWIGWQLMFSAGAVSLPDEKIRKLSDALGKVMSGSSCSNDTCAEASRNKLLTMSYLFTLSFHTAVSAGELALSDLLSCSWHPWV